MKIYAETDVNNVVLSYSTTIDNTRNLEIETELDLDSIDIVQNYKLENGQLVELTKEEKEANKIDICPGKTVEERLEVAEQENKLLKAQVEILSELSDFHEELIVELANTVYA